MKARAKGLATGPISSRRMTRADARAKGYARGKLRAEVMPEPVVSEGSVYVNGSSGAHARLYLLTASRLIWGPLRWEPHTEPMNPIETLNFDTVESFEVPHDNRLQVLKVTHSGGRKLTLSFLPFGVSGPRLRPAIDLLLRDMSTFMSVAMEARHRRPTSC